MKYWHLYWVQSDGIEDCFVVARNSRSARRIEIDMNGFDIDEVVAHRILRIPHKIEKSYIKKNKKCERKPFWPWYAYKDLLEELGAEFRTIDGINELLLEDIVYEECYEGYTQVREIGKKGMDTLRSDPILKEHAYSDEDVWDVSQSHLLHMLGMCVARCQQVEFYFVNAYLLGISEKEKKKYKTISERVDGWKKKTFGSMLKAIEDSYEIVPEVHYGLMLFRDMRNELVHGITTSERYDINTYWGQSELIVFLGLFDHISISIRDAARASYFASIDFGNEFLLGEEDEKIPLSKEEIEQVGLFCHFFTPKKQ